MKRIKAISVDKTAAKEGNIWTRKRAGTKSTARPSCEKVVVAP